LFPLAPRAVVAPTTFDDKVIPKLDLFFVRPAKAGETPVEDFIVGATGAHAGDELRDIDVEEAAEVAIEMFR
jgi:hypothetical protein